LTIYGLVTLYAKCILASKFRPAVSISVNTITTSLFQLPATNSEFFSRIVSMVYGLTLPKFLYLFRKRQIFREKSF